ncbi:hypothetical protein GEV33_000474 [Tenebrio molitor]|uniref:Uncharacterized protein n=1 Tax=Tenebrio molitor TaxID=7067 RepID=A0A8J6HXF9_TENMO|nr:hypothetical protein GEV33_000474 [Tenebrio molitor]
MRGTKSDRSGRGTVRIVKVIASDVHNQLTLVADNVDEIADQNNFCSVGDPPARVLRPPLFAKQSSVVCRFVFLWQRGLVSGVHCAHVMSEAAGH